MKTILALVLLGSYLSTAIAHDVTLDSYLDAVTKLKEVRPDDVDEGYLLLEREVKAKASVQYKIDKATMAKILKVHLFLLKNDKSNYGPELLAPIFKANVTLYKEGIKAFNKIEQKLIQYRQEVYEGESTRGNG